MAYGVAYDFSVGSNLGNSASAPPYAFRTSVTTPGGGLDNPYRDFPGGNPFPYVVNQNNATFLPFADYLPTTSYDMKPPSVQSWNLSLQRQITADVLASASYIGSHTTHMWITRSLNPAVYLPGGPCTINGVTYNPCSSTTNINQRRRLYLENAAEGQYYQVIDASTDGASSSYNGLLLSIQRRSVRGITPLVETTHGLDALETTPGSAEIRRSIRDISIRTIGVSIAATATRTAVRTST